MKDTKSKKVYFLTRQEAADFLRISIRTLDKLTRNGDIVHYKSGDRNSKVLFKIDDLLNYMETFRIDLS